MQVKHFFSVAGAISFLYGIALLLLPNVVAEFHQVTKMSNFTILNMRMLGGALVATGVMYWLAMPARLSYGRRAILMFTLIFDSILVIVNLLEVIMKGDSFLMRWVDIAICAAFAIGAGYFLTKEKDLKF